MLIAFCFIAGGAAWLLAVWIQKGHLFLCREAPRCARCAVPCEPPAADAELVRCANCGGDLTRANGVEVGIVRSTSRVAHSVVLAVVGVLLLAPPLLRPDDVRRAESRLYPTSVLVDRYVAGSSEGEELRHRLRTYDAPDVVEHLVERAVAAIPLPRRASLEPLQELLTVADAAKKLSPEQLHRLEAAHLDVTQALGARAREPRFPWQRPGFEAHPGFLRQIILVPTRVVHADGTETPIEDSRRIEAEANETVVVTVGILPNNGGAMRLDYGAPEYWPGSVIRFEVEMRAADVRR